MRVFLKALFAVALLASMLAFPLAARAAGNEVLTINVDLTTPGGRALIGTFVVQRGLGGGQASWTFSGMLDGTRLAADGTAIERWDANGNGEIELTAINGAGLTLEKLPLRKVTISASSNGLVTILGVPLAISGPINAPGAGDATLTTTNAGRGTQAITRLPNTAGDAPLAPELIVGMVLALGLTLVGIGFYLRRTPARAAR